MICWFRDESHSGGDGGSQGAPSPTGLLRPLVYSLGKMQKGQLLPSMEVPQGETRLGAL